MAPTPIPLSAQQIKALRVLDSKKVETALTAQQRLRDLDEFGQILCQHFLAEQRIEGGNYRLDLDHGLLIPNEPKGEPEHGK